MSIVDEKARQLLDKACAAENGRAAKLLVNDGPLRQTVIALKQGTTLQEHNSPPAASIFLFSGEVKVAGKEETTIGAGQLVTLTHQRHSVSALEDSVFLLTTVTSVEGRESHSGQS
ncbi:MAG TPA: cupin [Corynebacterium sp.]|nr:cupin [Corynebacterium sp.]